MPDRSPDAPSKEHAPGKVVHPNAPSWTRTIRAARARARQSFARVPAWHAPHSWSDTAGLYANEQTAWTYQELPLGLLRAGADGVLPLDHLLAELAGTAPERAVHILMHAWDERLRLPAETPIPLAAYLGPALSMFAPTRRLLLGVELRPAPPAGDGLRGAVSATGVDVVDHLLGEWVPDLASYSTDRERLEAILARYGAQAPTIEAAGHLESWYTLGAARNLEAVERDDVLLVDETDVIELTSVTALRPEAETTIAALMSGGTHGATVSSVRGELMGGGESAVRRDTTGALTKVSIVLGRRSSGARAPWSVDLRAFTGLEQRPLPMRQLNALEETLPCAPVRVCPALSRITGQHLRLVGFADTERMGDDAGLFLGMGRPHFSQPTYLNPGSSAVTLVTGSARSGKTFLLAQLAAQAAISGQRVRYLSPSAGEGAEHPAAALAALCGAAPPAQAPGALAGRGRHDPTLTALVQSVISAATPTLAEDERADLRSAASRAEAVGDLRTETVLSLCDLMSTVAKVRRSFADHEVAALTRPVLPVSHEADLPDVALLCVPGPRDGSREEPLPAAVADVAVAATIRNAAADPGPAGTVILVDGAIIGDSGEIRPHTRSVLEELHRAPSSAVHVVLAADGPVVEAVAQMAGNVVALAETDIAVAHARLRMLGLNPDVEQARWLTQAHAVVRDGLVERPALALHRDPAGRLGSLIAGPVPARTLEELSHGEARGYALST